MSSRLSARADSTIRNRKRIPTIVAFVDYYLPGFKAGGPIRAISNLVDTLWHDFHFSIVTRDRDLGDTEPYSGIHADTWVDAGHARIRYLSRERLSFIAILDTLQSTPYDIIYLNSFFSTLAIRVLMLRRIGLIRPVPVILAPRGELAPSALQFKELRKRAYVRFAKVTSLCRGVVWQASSTHEAEDIRAVKAADPHFATQIETTSELLSPETAPARFKRPEKQSGILNAAIVLRISNKKNLDGALRLLRGVRGNMTFSIYGPIEDPEHWQTCRRLIASLSPNVQVMYHGPISHDSVAQVLSSKDVFFFPAFGENFGHAIIEALEAGCPVLISDQTPWRELERHGVGWDIPLDEAERFHAVLERLIEMGPEEHSRMSRNAMLYVNSVARDPRIVESNRQLFQQLLGDTG